MSAATGGPVPSHPRAVPGHRSPARSRSPAAPTQAPTRPIVCTMPPRVGGSPGPADPYPPQAAWLGAAPTPRARQRPRPGLQPLALARRATPGARKMEAAAPPGDLDPSFPRPRGPGGGALTVAAPRPPGAPREAAAARVPPPRRRLSRRAAPLPQLPRRALWD